MVARIRPHQPKNPPVSDRGVHCLSLASLALTQIRDVVIRNALVQASPKRIEKRENLGKQWKVRTNIHIVFICVFGCMNLSKHQESNGKKFITQGDPHLVGTGDPEAKLILRHTSW